MATIKATSMQLFEKEYIDVFFMNTSEPARKSKSNHIIRVRNDKGSVVVELFDPDTNVSVEHKFPFVPEV